MSTEETKPTTRTFIITAAALALVGLAAPGAIDKELEEKGLIPAKSTSQEDRAASLIKAEGVSTQGHFAAVVINLTHGEGKELTADELTRALAEAFPGANIGNRHGPHYLSHARKGNLKGLREDLPTIKFSRKARKAGAEPENDVPVADGEQPDVTVKSLLADHPGKEGRKALQEMAGGMGLETKGKAKAIAGRIVDFMSEGQQEAAA